jgi:hypothetical protein
MYESQIYSNLNAALNDLENEDSSVQPGSREMAVALIKTEEAIMWVRAAAKKNNSYLPD